MVQVYTFQNNRNERKFLEVHVYGEGHYSWKQFIKAPKAFDVSEKIYVVGATPRNRKGRLGRVSKGTLEEVLCDYSLVKGRF